MSQVPSMLQKINELEKSLAIAENRFIVATTETTMKAAYDNILKIKKNIALLKAILQE